MATPRFYTLIAAAIALPLTMTGCSTETKPDAAPDSSTASNSVEDGATPQATETAPQGEAPSTPENVTVADPANALIEQKIVDPATHESILNAEADGPLTFRVEKEMAGETTFAVQCSAPTKVTMKYVPGDVAVALPDGGACDPEKPSHVTMPVAEAMKGLDVSFDEGAKIHVAVLVKRP